MTQPPAPRRILIVDDNRDAADTLSMMLDVLGARTAVAYDGLSALQLAPTFQPDAAIVDIGMPGMNGFDLALAVRNLGGMHDLLLIALTGWNDLATRERARAAGFDIHLAKPASLETLSCALRIAPAGASAGQDAR